MSTRKRQKRSKKCEETLSQCAIESESKRPRRAAQCDPNRPRRPTQCDAIDRSTEAAVDHNPRAMKPEPLDALPVRTFVDSRRKQ